MPSKQRRETLRQLIHSHEVENQERLIQLLAESGFEVTQSTLSRDLAELGISKHMGAYRLHPESQQQWRQIGFRSSTPAGPHLLVVKTETGAAQRVALLIDQAELTGVVGTLAGDDTIFLALSDASAQSAVQQRLEAGL